MARSARASSSWIRAYRRVDLWARWLWVAAIIAALFGGVFGLVVFKTTWLSLKVALFGLVILVGNALRLMPGTSSMALMAEIHRQGSTPDRETALYQRLSLTYPIILTIYACVVVSVFLGVLKPGLRVPLETPAPFPCRSCSADRPRFGKTSNTRSCCRRDHATPPAGARNTRPGA